MRGGCFSAQQNLKLDHFDNLTALEEISRPVTTVDWDLMCHWPYVGFGTYPTTLNEAWNEVELSP